MSDQQPSGGARKRGRGGRAPGIVFAAIASVLVVLVAAAFTPQQPPPPPTAEYAPEATKPIKAPPPNQTSEVGKQGDQGNRGGKNGLKEIIRKRYLQQHHQQQRQGTGPDGRTILTKNVRNCVGDPPRQIEDPESPPCVAYWDPSKGNGGKTWIHGVDANEIRIAMPNAGHAAQAMINFFNQRFEFYGRKIVLVTDAGGCWGAQSPESLKESADSIAQHNIFASVGYCDSKGMEYPLYDELARDQVVSIANRPGIETEAHMAQFHPYEWTFWPSFDEGQKEIGHLACALDGKTAQWAGGVSQTQTRKFGLIYNRYQDGSADLSAITDTLHACNIDPVTYGIDVPFDGGTQGQGYSQDTAQQVSTAVIGLRNAGVTSVIDLVHADTTKQIMQVCSSQGYEPEQIVSSYLYNDNDEYMSDMPADQQPHVIGVSTWNKHIHPVQEYWYQATEEGQPGYQFTDPSSYKTSKYEYYGAWYDYYPLLVLAAGIQMAGPHLTPETFANGLQEAHYPNPFIPGHQEGIVTVHPGQHSYIADATYMWFEPSNANPDYGTSGSFCYVRDGVRYQPDQTPADIERELFASTCPRYG